MKKLTLTLIIGAAIIFSLHSLYEYEIFIAEIDSNLFDDPSHFQCQDEFDINLYKVTECHRLLGYERNKRGAELKKKHNSVTMKVGSVIFSITKNEEYKIFRKAMIDSLDHH